MLKHSLFSYYWFGTCVRYLQDIKRGYIVWSNSDPFILYNLKEFFNYIDTLGLQVTDRASSQLKDIYQELGKLPKDTGLTDIQATKLAKAMNDVRKTLDAEIKGMEAYTVTPKRFDVGQLTESVEVLFAPGTYARLPPIAQFDFAESGKCIAFERSTAAAFHLLRGAEAVLKEFYCHLVRQKRCDLMWGPMVNDLRK